MSVEFLDAGASLSADPTRVVLRLFLPGDNGQNGRSRVQSIVDRIAALPPDEVEKAVRQITERFGGDAVDLAAQLETHAAAVAWHAGGQGALSGGQRFLLGAAFSAEQANEGAALCNPSAIPHPDQSGLKPGLFRVAVAMRAIGEGHISSIAFASAVIGPGRTWEFDPRVTPLVTPEVTGAMWSRNHFRQVLSQENLLGGLAESIIQRLPPAFDGADLEQVLATLPPTLAERPRAYIQETLSALRKIVAAAYVARFTPHTQLTQRVMVPFAPDEVHGVEDARFVQVTYPDGTKTYKATYTAFDGQGIASRLIVSSDLVTFEIHRMCCDAARTKGIALFPREIHGEMYALTRTDGESLSLAKAQEGLGWFDFAPVEGPSHLWDVVQIGDCGSPIETERGWLVLTHGVGPMRRYSLGAILLDLDHPEKVVARLEEPLLEPPDDERSGYVPNVVYSCGGVIHRGILWLPYGVADNRIRVGSVVVDDLLDAMAPASAVKA